MRVESLSRKIEKKENYLLYLEGNRKAAEEQIAAWKSEIDQILERSAG